MLDPLHFLMCGSVDDGKSTLLGRLLWNSQQVFQDHLSALERDSKRYGTQGDDLDLALLVDGLQAEREQGITIDVAHRTFRTPCRRFIVADTPGHEQYTRNMATGASTSDLAILVVNASNGLRMQTHRHARIAALLGIRHVAIAINKMDLVGWSEAVFRRTVDELRLLAEELKFKSFQPIPISALNGDNVSAHSRTMPWYDGPTLLDHLEQIDVSSGTSIQPFRMSVQFVNRTSGDFRGYCGRVASGQIKVGEQVRILPYGLVSTVRSIVAWKQELFSATAGDSVTLCLSDQLDVARGNVISSSSDPGHVSDQFQARILSLSEHPLIAGRTYIFNLHRCAVSATITAIKHQTDVVSGKHVAAKSLAMNEVGVVHISTDRPVPFEEYENCRSLGGFILVDRFSNETVGAGMIDFPLRRAANIHWQPVEIHKTSRAHQKLQKPLCVWLTGLPASGKSTIANQLEKHMFEFGRHTYILDGDNVRHGLNRDLGFSEPDRVENIRRVTEVARLLVDAGLIVIVSFISPYRAERDLARSRFETGEFIEVFVDAPLEECEKRDPKGLYAKARRGELFHFTGIDSSYEPPRAPEIHLDTVHKGLDACVDEVLSVVLHRSEDGFSAH